MSQKRHNRPDLQRKTDKASKQVLVDAFLLAYKNATGFDYRKDLKNVQIIEDNINATA